VLGVILSPIGLLVLAIIGLVALIVIKKDELGMIFSQIGSIFSLTFSTLWNTTKIFGQNIGVFLSQTWDQIKTNVGNKWANIKDKFVQAVENIKRVLQIDWVSVGRNIVLGIANGISSFASLIADAARGAALRAFEAAKRALQFGSPSKLFMEIGIGTMQSMALGIEKSAGVAVATMQGAMSQVSSAAVPSVTNSTVVNNSNAYNLTVNSGASTEPIIQDFDMMQSLSGV